MLEASAETKGSLGSLESDGPARALLDAIANVVVILAENRRILAWNRAAEDIFGWSRDEVLGRDYFEMVVPEAERAAVVADMRKVLEGEETHDFDNPVRSRDGTRRILRWHVRRLLDGAGKARVIVASGYDITQHKIDQEKLARSQAELQAIIDGSTVLIFVKDLEGRFILTNRSFDGIVAQGPGFAIGKTDPELLPPEAAAQTRLNDQLALDARGPIAFEERIPVAAGLRIFSSSKFPLFDTRGEPYAVCGISADITDLREAEEERARLQAQVIEAQRESLRELSTPLLPIASGVVLIPLVGAIDQARAALVLETLLEGVSAHRAEIAILDITGVSMVDASVALGLVQAAQAARLLGAEVLLTGVSPQAARTLVELATDMRGIKTLSRLEQGVEYAMRRAVRGAPKEAR
jgi:rsbT co-antagonist protein RsbR